VRRIRHGRLPRRAAAALVALAVLALPATAGARRDDKPAELYAPADGAVVKNAVKGLKVDFTCPAYHPDIYDFIINEGPDGYSLTLSTSPDVDQYGALVPGGIVDVRPAFVNPKLEGHCGSDVNQRGETLLPREPGTYYWQASRTCQTYACPGGIEVSFVNKVEVRTTVCSALRSQSAGARSALGKAKRSLRKRPRSKARKARVARLDAKIKTLRQRQRVVYECRR